MAAVNGGQKLAKALRDIANKVGKASTVRVGFLENATYPDGTKVASVAAIQNFGAPGAGVPAHPFFTTMVRDKSPAWGRRFADVLTRANYNTDLALERMGQGIAGQLRGAIVEMDSPALSPVTILLRQRFPDRVGMTFGDVQDARRDIAEGKSVPSGGTLTKPLVWTGVMLGAVDSEVE